VARLVAWYRIGSSSGAAASLVLANLLPLAGVLWFGWSVRTVLIVYWLENGVIGAVNVLKILRAEGTAPAGPARPAGRGTGGRRVGTTLAMSPTIPTTGQRAALVPFFVLHYGTFWLVHGIFVLSLPLFSTAALEETSTVDTGPEPGQLLIVVVLLAISHLVSYRLNFIGRGEYLRVSPVQQVMAPYGRLVVLHVTIIVGGIAIAGTGAPAAAVLILVLLKTAMDLGFHLAEHRDDAIETTDAGGSRGARGADGADGADGEGAP
jgi:hypothetical protein